MPQLMIKGLTDKQCQEFARVASKDLAEIVGCPQDWFLFDLVASKVIDYQGNLLSHPIVQVWWFKRPMDVQEKVADYLHQSFQKMGFTMDQISFHTFDVADFYENGQKF